MPNAEYDELQIGFAPPGTSHPDITSDLAEYLNSSPPFHGKLALSGLFTFLSPQGPFWDFFKARIVFPYWKSGKVVYMTARATIHTSPDRYECYTDADGNIKAGENGKPQFIKYKKLRTQDLNDDKRKYISKFIQNDAFMGEDVIRGAREVIITEGAPDWISAVDKGFAAVSPVTTSFREQDWEKLGNLTSKAGSIYIINDNEDNAAGLQGAKRTAQHLSEKGKNVFIVQLPKPAGAGKIDLNEYLVSHSASDLRKVMEESHTYIDLLIEELPTDYIKAQSRIKEEVAPAMLNLEGNAGILHREAEKESQDNPEGHQGGT
jgi:DNA primase